MKELQTLMQQLPLNLRVYRELQGILRLERAPPDLRGAHVCCNPSKISESYHLVMVEHIFRFESLKALKAKSSLITWLENTIR